MSDRLPTIALACVQNGDKYTFGDVARLIRAVRRHTSYPLRPVVYTDNVRPYAVADGEVVRTASAAWWAKMELFDTARRPAYPTLFLDLDSLIVGSLDPLISWMLANRPGFAICESFTRAAGNKAWPCAYGSCAMWLPAGFGASIWNEYSRDPYSWRKKAGRYGDQRVIEWLTEDRPPLLLQRALPGFFVGYRDLGKHQDAPPEGASVIVYAGGRTPETFGPEWARAEWRK